MNTEGGIITFTVRLEVYPNNKSIYYSYIIYILSILMHAITLYIIKKFVALGIFWSFNYIGILQYFMVLGILLYLIYPDTVAKC